jgi:hypothetical protein
MRAQRLYGAGRIVLVVVILPVGYVDIMRDIVAALAQVEGGAIHARFNV